MSFLTALYTLLIRPLELLFEIIFSVVDRITPSHGLTIIALSLAMNFLVLPLYKRADAMQEEERRAEEKIGPWQERIKKTFKGDERFMMLQAFYRENNYKPTDALKGSLSLLLEIPFFIAAYRMLSGLKLLHGVKFGPIEDLGAPDHMIVIGAVAINLLPILMTLINIVSSAIYTKGLPTKA
ncbi:MAG: YidC/Oxa1 family membrane protein insertase, partial [Clostridiales bacterium]|nr:YidC/Oxa1 family membrane protein insertase [Clostridiales bacterium]